MNKNEIKVFGFLSDMFGHNTSKFIYNIYCDMINDDKILGILLSLPFIFFKFWGEEWKKSEQQQ